MDLDIEISQVVFMGHCTNTWYTKKKLKSVLTSLLVVARSSYGSDIRRSVSLMIRFGRAILEVIYTEYWKQSRYDSLVLILEFGNQRLLLLYPLQP